MTAAFAGLLTKIGVYAIIRVETVIFPGPELNPALMVVALLPTREYNARALMWRLLKVATCLVGVGYFGAKLPFMKQRL